MVAEEFGLGDLNIVAITPQAKQQPKKKKKNNKYERRRQRAQKAKKQTPANTNQEKAAEVELGVTQNVGKKETPTIQENLTKLPDESSSDNVSEGRSQHDVKEAVEKSEEVPITPVSVDTGSEKSSSNVVSEKASKVEAEDVTVNLVMDENVEEKSRRRNHKETDKETEEHAKYMAEFHARPMELDRRSGARSGRTNVSTSSKYIFGTDTDSWEGLKINPRLTQSLISSDLTNPTTIQAKTIKAFQKSDRDGRSDNVLVHSETGSGKTLAYLLPMLQSIAFDTKGELRKKNHSRKELGTKSIILCPTRELASQTLEVLERLCQSCFAGWLVPGGLLGGDSRQSEKARVRKGLGIVVATPGRMLDHLQKTQSLLLGLKGKLEWLVLDEADRLLDMGLGDQVRQIVQIIRANEASKSTAWFRSVLVSATVTESVQKLAKERMLCGDQKWIWVKAGRKKEKKTSGEDGEDNNGVSEGSKPDGGYSESTPHQLAQFHLTVTAKLRLSTLVSFLVQRVSKGERTVVFMGTCACVDYHHKLFESMENCMKNETDDEGDDSKGLFGPKILHKLHGSVKHAQRSQTLKRFSATSGAAILLTTDVAARGLNLKGIDWTVQYDPPCEISDYVHRVGRVARAGKAGHSLLFLLPSEKGYLDVLQTKGISEIPAMSLSNTLNQAAKVCVDWAAAGRVHGGSKGQSSKKRNGGDSRLGEYFAAEVQYRLEECVVQDDIAAKAAEKEKKKEKDKKRRRNAAKAVEGQLMELARAAFLSFLRAYPTKKEPSVRSIFSARALHFGHIARSFALKEPPKSLSSKHRNSNDKEQEKEKEMDKLANLPASLDFSRLENNLVNYNLEEDEDNDEERPFKRSKQKKGSKGPSAKQILLENARKMQSNLMDAM